MIGESNYSALQRLNLGKRFVSKGEVAEELTAHLQNWRTQASQVTNYKDTHVQRGSPSP